MTATRNPQLQPFEALVGEWRTEATHLSSETAFAAEGKELRGTDSKPGRT